MYPSNYPAIFCLDRLVWIMLGLRAMIRLVTAALISVAIVCTLLVLVSALALPGSAGTLGVVEKTEPTSLLLFGTTLAGIGMVVRRTLKRTGSQSNS